MAAAVFRMGQERLLPLEQNIVSRAIFAVYRPSLRGYWNTSFRSC